MSETADELNAVIDGIKKKYQPKIDELVARGQKIKDDFDDPGAVGGAIRATIKVEWKDVTFEFGLPSVAIRDQDISFDLPQVTMVEQNWSFGIPSVCQQDTYPFPWPLDHTVIKVPYPCIQQTTIIFHLPSVTMVRQDIVLGVPVFSMENIKWVIGLPQFTVINVDAEVAATQAAGKQLENDANAVGAAMKQEITLAISIYLNPKTTDDITKRDEVKQKFDAAIIRVNSAISEISGAGGNPETVPDGKGGQINLRTVIADLTAQQDGSLKKVDAVIQEIHDAHS